jgi:hypothetical protein
VPKPLSSRQLLAALADPEPALADPEPAGRPPS